VKDRRFNKKKTKRRCKPERNLEKRKKQQQKKKKKRPQKLNAGSSDYWKFGSS